MQAPIFALTALGAEAALGAFARARQLVSMPITVLGGAVAQVFRREAAELYRTTGSCRGLMLRTAGGLLLAGIVPCLLFMALAPWLFTVYLGPSWREAGEIARILAPMLLLRVIVSPLTTVFSFTGNQPLSFQLMMFSSLLIVPTIIYSAVFISEWGLIVAFSACYAVVYIMFLVFSLRIAKGNHSYAVTSGKAR